MQEPMEKINTVFCVTHTEQPGWNTNIVAHIEQELNRSLRPSTNKFLFRVARLTQFLALLLFFLKQTRAVNI